MLNIKTWYNQLVVKFVYTTNTAATTTKADYRESAEGGKIQ